MFVMNKVRGYGGQYREHSYDMFILKPSVGIQNHHSFTSCEHSLIYMKLM